MRNILFIAALAGIALAGCKKDDDKPENIPDFTVTVSGEYTYTGTPVEPSGANVTVKAGSATLTAGTDYTLSYSDHTNAGTATVTATGAGSYAGKSGNAHFTIKPIVATLNVTVSGTYTYNGTPVEPSGASVVVKYGDITLSEGADYTLSYNNNTNAGAATVTVTGTGNYTGGETTNFTVVPCPISVMANNESKAEGAVDAPLTYTTVPALYGSDVLPGALTRTPGETLGTYAIMEGTLSGGDNYEITSFTGGVFTINLYFAGEGTKEKPYVIDELARLVKFRDLVNAGNAEYNSKYYKLMADIDLNVAPHNTSSGWSTIGWTHVVPFRGYFDGNNHKVSGLYINDKYYLYSGLFGYIENGEVQNLGVVDVNITGGSYIGSLAGYITGATITNCYATGELSGEVSVGGLTGYVQGGSVSNCFTNISVNSDYNGNNVVGGCGGLAGYVANNANITNCYVAGVVNGKDYFGGLAGYLTGNATITNCYVTSAVNGSNYVGGLVGFIQGGSVENCAALNPNITGNGNGRVAGNIHSSIIGTLANNVAWGGMTGGIDNVPIATTNDAASPHGADITATDAKKQVTYTNQLHWNFGNDNENPWKWIGGSYSLPVLYWQDASTYPALPEHLK